MRAHDSVQNALHGMEPVVEIAVWHGWEGIAGMNDSRLANAHKTCTMTLSTLTIQRNIPFDFIDSRVIASATIDGETLRTKLADYKVLVMPYAVALAGDAWEVCKRFAAAGGRLVFVGPPPSFTTNGRDISAEFAELVELAKPLSLADYKSAIDAQFTLPNHRASLLDCCISMRGYSANVAVSAEGEPHAASTVSGRVVYLTDLDPRARLLDVVAPWLTPEVECYSDNVLWRLYKEGDRRTLVLIAKEGRTISALVRFAGRLWQATGGTSSLMHHADGQVTMTGDGVTWKEIPG
jgi:hypothetical protein